MHLLSLLYSSVSEEKKMRIGELFNQMVKRTDEFQQLMKLLQTVTFLGHDGVSKKNESLATLENSVTGVLDATKSIEKMNLLVHQICNDIKRAEALLASPRYFDDDLTAVLSEDIEVYHKYYKVLANVVCYYMISQFGIKGIRNLTYNHRAGFQDLVRLVNQQYANELSMSSRYLKPVTWAVVKTAFAGDNFIEYDGYRIVYSNQLLSGILQKVSVGEYRRVAPYLFAATSSLVDAPFVGIGNIIGVEATNGLALLNSEIVTSLPINAFGDEDIEFLNPLGEIKNALHTDCYCLFPESLVSAMNRWSFNKAVRTRRESGKCIVCGKDLGQGKVACSSHFTINQ